MCLATRRISISPGSANKFDFILRRNHKQISYERRDYESVDNSSLSIAMSRKTTKKNRSVDGKSFIESVIKTSV